MSSRSLRPAPSRRLLRQLFGGICCTLLLASAAGCGSQTGDGDDSGSATDSSSQAPSDELTSDQPMSDQPTPDPGSPKVDPSSGSGGRFVVGETVEPGQAVIVSASNVDAETSVRASALVNDKAVAGFLAATDARLANDVRAAVSAVQVPADSTLFGAVVSVGCDKPTAITWTKTFEGIEVTPTLPKSGVQCLVPVTSVALFLVPN